MISTYLTYLGKLIDIIKLRNFKKCNRQQTTELIVKFFFFTFTRWIHEGHLHVNRVNLFLPENSKHGVNFSVMVPSSSRNFINGEFHLLLKHFKADKLPDIDFKTLLLRFCDELQLPSDNYFFTNYFSFILFYMYLFIY